MNAFYAKYYSQDFLLMYCACIFRLDKKFFYRKKAV